MSAHCASWFSSLRQRPADVEIIFFVKLECSVTFHFIIPLFLSYPRPLHSFSKKNEPLGRNCRGVTRQEIG